MWTQIPPITDPLGKYWEQPDTSEILIDDTYALMKFETLAKLKNYSLTNPTGAYPGKMWRKEHITWNENDTYKGTNKWLLCWYGYSSEPGYVSNNYREILFID